MDEDRHYYSMPHRYIGKEAWIAYCADIVEVYCDGQRIASHNRNYTPHGYTSVKNTCPNGTWPSHGNAAGAWSIIWKKRGKMVLHT